MENRNRAPKNYIVYDFVRITAAIPGLIALRPKLVYENEAAKRKLRGGVLLISNHAGFFDPVYLMLSIRYRRHHFVCIKDFFEGNRFKRWLFTQFHCIPIDRENFSMDSLRRITDELKAGRLVSMFPEGHVVGEKELAPFKSGMVLMALRGNCPILPVYVKPQEHFWNRLTVAVGEPVDLRGMYGPLPSLSQIDEAANMLRDKENKLKDICCSRSKGTKAIERNGK